MHVGVIHRISDPEGSNAPNRRPLRRASLTALVFPSMPPLPTTGPASASGKDLRSMQFASWSSPLSDRSARTSTSR